MEVQTTDQQGERRVRLTPGIARMWVCSVCVCVCGIRLSACGNFTPDLAHNRGGLHVCTIAASTVLSE